MSDLSAHDERLEEQSNWDLPGSHRLHASLYPTRDMLRALTARQWSYGVLTDIRTVLVGRSLDDFKSLWNEGPEVEHSGGARRSARLNRGKATKLMTRSTDTRSRA